MEWAWMGGTQDRDSIGDYSASKTPSATAFPASRTGHLVVANGAGSVWVGFGASAYGDGDRNDLWHYDESTHQWTWWTGDSVPEAMSVYGDVPAASSAPRVHRLCVCPLGRRRGPV